MKVKETIVFIAETDEFCSQLIQNLAAENYPLVLVSAESNHFEDLALKIKERMPEADIENIQCAREGCWEADVIVIGNAINPGAPLLEKIKEVASHKILVCLSTEGNSTSFPAGRLKDIQQLLPNTEVVQVIADPVSGEMQITGTEAPAAVIENIFNRAGYAGKRLQVTG
jgi:hypothetical protein